MKILIELGTKLLLLVALLVGSCLVAAVIFGVSL